MSKAKHESFKDGTGCAVALLARDGLASGNGVSIKKIHQVDHNNSLGVNKAFLRGC